MNEPSFIERDLEAIKARLMSASDITPLDPEYVVLESLAYEMYLTRCNVQDACVQNLLQFSTYPVIDYLGALKETPRNEGETTEAYAERLKTVMDSYAVAGPEDAYRYLVKQVDSKIIDVGLKSDVNAAGSLSGILKIYVHTSEYWTAELLAEEIALPNEEKTLVEGVWLQDVMQSLLSAVEEALSDKKVRPLTERVYVYFPSKVLASYVVSVTAKKEVEFDLVSLGSSLVEAIAVFADRLENNLGVDSVVSQLIASASLDGVYSVSVEGDGDIPAGPDEFIESDIDIEIVGVVDEK